jgi:hypothetical protein
VSILPRKRGGETGRPAAVALILIALKLDSSLTTKAGLLRNLLSAVLKGDTQKAQLPSKDSCCSQAATLFYQRGKQKKPQIKISA